MPAVLYSLRRNSDNSSRGNLRVGKSSQQVVPAVLYSLKRKKRSELCDNLRVRKSSQQVETVWYKFSKIVVANFKVNSRGT